MTGLSDAPAQGVACFEVLPLGKSEEEAKQLPEPAWLTVTCSPKHGPDRTIEVAKRLRALGHDVTPHIAARMVKDRDHLNRLLDEMAQAGMYDVFVIGGDATEVLGDYSSAGELLPHLVEHPHRPRTIGIAAYPEGHPRIDDRTLAAALEYKSRFATYATTQMCFDPGTLLSWLRQARAGGMSLPVMLGMPGVVDRRRLLEISMRIGVGPSLSFVRKQQGIRKLFSRSQGTADELYDALAPSVRDDPELNIEGFHFYTFNQLVDTWRWERGKRYQGDLAQGSGSGNFTG
jgi:methylenetetrahydrofolate reductase (NADPH)